MEVGKVTNWFRNLRQTARKRGSRLSDADQDGSHSGLDEDLDGLDADEMSPFSSTAHSNPESRSASRSRHGSPPRSASEGSSSNIDIDMDRRTHSRHLPHPALRDDEAHSNMMAHSRRRSPSPLPTIPHDSRAFSGRDFLSHRQSYPSPPTLHHMQTRHQEEYNYRPTASQHRSDPPPQIPSFVPPQAYSHHSFDHPRETFHKTRLPSLISKEPPPHLREVHTYQHAPGNTASTDISFGRFSASMSFFDSPYRPSANKGYYANDDPVSCAAAAKRFGINLEDAYLLLDFHRQ